MFGRTLHCGVDVDVVRSLIAEVAHWISRNSSLRLVSFFHSRRAFPHFDYGACVFFSVVEEYAWLSL